MFVQMATPEAGIFICTYPGYMSGVKLIKLIKTTSTVHVIVTAIDHRSGIYMAVYMILCIALVIRTVVTIINCHKFSDIYICIRYLHILLYLYNNNKLIE